jgi:uncharacterized protein YwgA
MEQGGAERLKPAWVALVAILARIEREPYHYPVGRIMFQKIAYFATALGLPTGLEYRRGSYGPFAEALKGLITRLVNNGLIREEQWGQMFVVKVGPTYEDTRRLYPQELEEWQPLLERVADLFLRMRTAQAEVAATVHFAATALRQREDEKPTERRVWEEVMQWKQKRRPPLEEREVTAAIRNLAALGWIDVQASADLPFAEEALLIA